MKMIVEIEPRARDIEEDILAKRKILSGVR